MQYPLKPEEGIGLPRSGAAVVVSAGNWNWNCIIWRAASALNNKVISKPLSRILKFHDVLFLHLQFVLCSYFIRRKYSHSYLMWRSLTYLCSLFYIFISFWVIYLHWLLHTVSARVLLGCLCVIAPGAKWLTPSLGPSSGTGLSFHSFTPCYLSGGTPVLQLLVLILW